MTPNFYTSKKTFIALATAVLLLAAAFRIYHLTQRPIWTDEGTTTFNLFHFNGQSDLISGLAARDHHPPLYYLLMQAWVALTGESVLAMRYVSALAGILSVALMLPLARLMFSAADAQNRLPTSSYWFVPLGAALVLALSDPDIDLAQDIRFYTLRTLFIILSVLFYLRWLRKPNPARAALWTAANVAILHTNYQGAFIMLFEGLHALLYLRGRLRWTALGWLALAGVLFLPWFVGYGYGQLDNEQGVNSTLPSTWDTFVELVYKFLGRQWPLMLGLMLVGVIGYQSTVVSQQSIVDSNQSKSQSPTANRRWLPDNLAVLLILWLVLTLIISFAANEWFSILSPRRVMLISPAIALLVARGLAWFSSPTRLFLVAVLLVYGAATVDDYYPKVPWDKVGADMARYAQPGQMVLMEIYYDDTVMYYYSDQWMPPATEAKSLRMWRQFEASTYPGGVLDLLKQYDTVWLVHWSKDLSAFEFLKQTGHVQSALMTTYWGSDALNVYRFDRLPAEPAAAFTNGMVLRQFAIHPDTLRVDVWWSADAPLDKDYSVSVFLLNEAGQLVAQSDSFPFVNQRPTTGWQAGKVVYDPHVLLTPPPNPLPAGREGGLPPGTYTVAVQLYTYYDGVKYPPISGGDWQVLGTVER